MNIIVFCIIAFTATFIGGLLAFRFKDKLHLVLGFSAGAVLAVAFFELLPEAIELGVEKYDVASITTLVAIGFFVFMLADRLFGHHAQADEECEHHQHRGWLGAGSLSIHSVFDGIATGLAFQVSPALGLVVGLAVLAHDFSDGLNMVNLVLRAGGGKKAVMKWLFLNSLAPVIGVVIAYMFPVSSPTLGLLLAIFCGFFLYIGASDLLPESHHAHPTRWTTFATIIGAGVLFAVIQIAGH